MANRAKEKGDRFERSVVHYLNNNNIPAQRVPLSGAVRGFPGDVTIECFNPPIIVQCKHFANSHKRLFALAEKNLVTIVSEEHGGDIYFLMMFERFIDWWKNHRMPLFFEPPVEFLRFADCARWLEREDMLLVKRDRGSPFALIKNETLRRMIKGPIYEVKLRY